MKPKDKIIFAADVGSLDELKKYLAAFGNEIGAVKLGMEILTHDLLTGEGIVKYVLEHTSLKIMWDLKYGDIAATVAGAAKEVAKYGKGRILGFTVHCMSGRKGLEDAVKAVKDNFGDGPDAPMVIAVTLLTSLDQSDLNDLGIQGTPKEVVLRWAKMAAEAKVPAVVSSPQETSDILKINPDFIVINPGIRFAGSDLGTQKRVTTPGEAVANGASYIVMGSDLRNGDPLVNARRAVEEIEEVLAKKRLIDILRSKSYKFSIDPPFTLASGRKSPYYFNCKPTYLDPEGMVIIGSMICRKIQGLGIEAIGGLELGAVPPSCAVSVISQVEGEPISTFIVRKDKKDHGEISAIEGDIKPGQKVAVFDDVITTGGSTIRAIEAAQAKGLEVAIVIVIVDRQEGGRENIEKHFPGIKIVALTLRDEVMTDEQRVKVGLPKDK